MQLKINIKGEIIMNNMEKVADILGVKLDEKFTIAGRNPKQFYTLTDTGLKMYNVYGAIARANLETFNLLLQGVLEIKRTKFIERIKYGDKYYFVRRNGDVECMGTFFKDVTDLAFIFIGNMFETEQEALDNKDRIVELLDAVENKRATFASWEFDIKDDE